MTTIPPLPATLAELLRDRAAAWPAAPALLAPGRSPLDYRALHRLVGRTGQRLAELGIGRGHRVALVLPNGPELAAAFLAVASHACAAPLNPALQEDEFAFHLEDMRADALLIEQGDDSSAAAVARRLGIRVVELTARPTAPAGTFELTGPLGTLPDGRRGPAGPHDTALVLHTSGTTARAKLVPLTQTNLCAAAHNTARAFALGPDDRCLNVMPLFHAHGLVSTVLAVVCGGGATVCAPGFSDTRFFDWLTEFRPTWYSAVPAMHQALLASATVRSARPTGAGLRFIRSASAPLPVSVLEALEEEFGAPVLEAYGMSESGSLVTSNPLPPGVRKPGSVGLPVGEPVAVLDRQGRPLGPGREGTIAIRGANVMAGYENAPEANRAAFHDGWLRTGDEGRLDEDGYLYLTGRTKEIVNRGGSKVSPAEVDGVLAGHPAVATAVAFGTPHPTLGEDLAVAVVTVPGAVVSERDIREYAAQRLAGHKVPSRVHFVDDVPRTAAGKVRRLELAGLLAATAGTRPTATCRGTVADLVAQVWTEVLGRVTVAHDDNFFDLGGDSLGLATVAARLEQELNRELPVLELTMYPTVAALAEHLAAPGASGAGQNPAAGPSAHAALARQRLLRQRQLVRRTGEAATR